MKTLTIFYDNYCPNCSKFTSLIQKLDWLKLIQVKQLRNKYETDLFLDIDIELAKKQMASFDKKWQYGYISLYQIFLRLPVFWVFIPLFYILKITPIGQYLYTQLAINRKIIPIHCSVETCNI